MYSTVLAPIDVQAIETCEKLVLRAAFHLQHSSTKLHLLAVAPAGADEGVLNAHRTQLLTLSESNFPSYQERIELHVRAGLPSEAMLELAKTLTADFILMGSHRGGTGQLGRVTLGSTAAKVAALSTCDVCIVKA